MRIEMNRHAYVHDLEQHLQLSLFGNGVADPDGAVLLVRGALADGDQAEGGQPGRGDPAAGRGHAG